MSKRLSQYRRKSHGVLWAMLGIWALVSYVLAITLAVPLDRFRIGGFPLGFWLANQGSVLVYVALISAYCAIMDRLDRRYDMRD